MADRGRVGSLVVASKQCARKHWRATHEGHRKRIGEVKASSDSTVPMSFVMDHCKNNLKKERILEDRYMEIDRENQVLLKKMADIMKKPPEYKSDPVASNASLNRTGRKIDLLEITKENRRMLKAIQAVKPVYCQKSWEADYQHSEVLLRNCASYPVITRMPRSASTPSVLMRISPEDGTMSGSGSVRGGSPSGRGGTPKGEDGKKYVLKEGKSIGGAYYLIEMATDGRTLNISAYDGQSQTSLECMVNEKNHRRLYRDSNGDYSQILSQLRVDGSRLSIDAAAFAGGD